MNTENKLPSRFFPGDSGVKIVIPGKPALEGGNITKVHFSESKVMYDIEFPFFMQASGKPEDDTVRGYTRLHNVDSAFVDDMNWTPSIVEGGGYDGRYHQNDRGRWERKPEFKDQD